MQSFIALFSTWMRSRTNSRGACDFRHITLMRRHRNKASLLHMLIWSIAAKTAISLQNLNRYRIARMHEGDYTNILRRQSHIDDLPLPWLCFAHHPIILDPGITRHRGVSFHAYTYFNGRTANRKPMIRHYGRGLLSQTMAHWIQPWAWPIHG